MRTITETNYGLILILRINMNICACLEFNIHRTVVRKQVVKNMGMLRSYSVEEDSGNRSRQMLKEVRSLS